MNLKQDYAGQFERNSALNCDVPEIFIQREHDARFGFGEAQ